MRRGLRGLHRPARRPRRAAWRATGAPRRCCAPPEGRDALGIGEDEHAIGLLHLGPARQEQRPPERAPARDVVSFLD